MPEENTEAVEKLRMELAKLRAHQDAKGTVDKIEQQATMCQDALGNVQDAREKTIRIFTKSTSQWNADIKENRREDRSHELRSLNSEDRPPGRTPINSSHFHSRGVKHGTSTCKTCQGPRYGAQHNTQILRHTGLTVVAVIDSESKQANTSLEKEEMRRHKSFHLNHHNQDNKLPPVESAQTHSTEQAVDKPDILNWSTKNKCQTRSLLSQFSSTDSGTNRGLRCV
jgi:hypothetical protein